MPVQFDIPKGSRFIQRANQFTGTYGTPTIFRYDFAIPANTNQVVIEAQGNAVYLIDCINFGATVDEGVYLNSIDPTDPPVLVLSRRLGNQPGAERVYRYPIPLVNYVDNQQTAAFFWSDRSGDALLISMAGKLRQVAETVGEPTITASVNLNIYEIQNLQWVQKFKDGTLDSGRALRI